MSVIGRFITDKEAYDTNLWNLIREPIFKKMTYEGSKGIYPSPFSIYESLYDDNNVDPIRILIASEKTVLLVRCDNEDVSILVVNNKKIIGALNTDLLNPIVRATLFWTYLFPRSKTSGKSVNH